MIVFAMLVASPAQKPILVPVPPPRGESSIAAGPSREPEYLMPPFTISVNGKAMSIRNADADNADDDVLTATVSGRRVWGIPPLSAGGTETTFFMKREWNVLLADQSRTGVMFFDLSTGMPMSDAGYEGMVVSPDGKWALLPPWFSWLSECFVDSRTLRLTLRGQPKTKVVETMPKSESCPGQDSERRGFENVAFSADGKYYALVRAGQAYEDGLVGDGVVKLFQSSDDKELTSLKIKFPPHCTSVEFSKSGNYLILRDEPEAGRRDETQWLRIMR